MRVLLLTPWVPYPITGACQQDRFYGILQLHESGNDVRVLGRIHGFQPKEEVEEAFRKEGVPLTLVPHSENAWPILFKNLPRVLSEPALLDGAALEYVDPQFTEALDREMQSFKPDVVWMDFTTHWPVMRYVKKRYKVPVIIKSTLIEPYSAMAEAGYSLSSKLKFPFKYLGELIATRESDYLLPITHEEDDWYRAHGAKRTKVLPLRGLYRCFTEKHHRQKDVLDVVFLSSSYSMGHNRDAMLFLVEKIVPLVRKRAPGKFRFHLTGRKFPKKYEHLLADDVRAVGFVDDLGALLAGMDIALCPWITGYGMQQKVFEPLCRGLPLITTKLAGYPFEQGKEVFLANTPEEYVDALLLLQDPAERQRISDAALKKSKELFSKEAVSKIANDVLQEVVGAGSK